jgi:8-oxo-dGTP pyrophosphatase MutT (NUDIX family)
LFPNGSNPNPDRRIAAVLMLVRLIEATPHMLFIRRSQKVSRHKGQISFPGGSKDSGDLSLEFTALREANEEMGIDPNSLRVLGSLPATDTVASNFLVHPYIAVPHEPAAHLVYRTDDYEVDAIIEIPLPHIVDPNSKRIEQWIMRGTTFPASFYAYKNHVIWGATARILDDFTRDVSEGKWQELFELGG